MGELKTISCKNCGHELIRYSKDALYPENIWKHKFKDIDAGDRICHCGCGDPFPKDILFYSKIAEYEWLSNFHECPQIVDGIEYPTNEHWYQSQKAISKENQDWISSSPKPWQAKQRGRKLSIDNMKKDWDNIKIEIMLKGLRAKFQNPELRQKLLETGDASLHEDSPKDLFWGIRGKDMLGKLLMIVREEIRGG